MHAEPSALLGAWSNFYVITGSAAAALTGLMFVVMTLVAGGRKRTSTEGVATFSSPTVVHFCAALFLSAVLSAPWHSLAQAALMLELAGAYGVAYTLRAVHRTRRQNAYAPDFEDWFWYAVLPLGAYVAIIAGAIRLTAAPTAASFALAAATLLLIFVGIRNAWDVVTYIAIEHVQTTNLPDEPNVAGGASGREPARGK